ncbi:MAG: YdcF family protein [Patescibacteria group bacterium]
MTRPPQIKWIVSGALAVVAAWSVSFTTWPAELLALPLTVYQPPRPADVVIVLGAGARKHPSSGKGQTRDPLPPQAKERIIRGAGLIQQGYAPAMIVAGGYSKQSGYVEAQLMKPFAVSRGIAPAQIIAEDQSKNTWENAVNSLAVMQRNGWQSALVVTSSYHTLRACAIFRKLQADVRCIAAPLNTIPTDTVYERLTDFRSVVREYGALVYNLVQGRL